MAVPIPREVVVDIEVAHLGLLFDGKDLWEEEIRFADDLGFELRCIR